MASRKDIGARRIGYTRRCGWVDWGHARPGGVAGLKAQIDRERGRDVALRGVDLTFEGVPAYVLTYGQGMGVSAFGQVFKISTDHLWVVKKGLTTAARERVALGIFLTASHEFERFQGRLPLSWMTRGSSFSVEDLVSNLIGFYAAYRGFSVARLRQICGEVSLEESYRIWDRHTPGGISHIKNYSTRPVLFPTKEGVRSPADISFPAELATIRPAPEGGDWVRPARGQLDQRLVGMGAKINVSRAGRVEAAAPGSMAFPARGRGQQQRR